MLDDLAGVIETLQGRIRNYGDTLRQNEIRTRVALIDPLLQALGWDVADPGLATPEYEISGQRVDYALLGPQGKPAATVEAKKLGEPLASHRMQMLNYSNAAGIAYAGLTDGNQWELYEVFKQVTLEERRLLDLRLLDTPAHECALKLLLLWRPNLATGRPIKANVPIAAPLIDEPAAAPTAPTPAATAIITQSTPHPDGYGWTSLANIQKVKGKPAPSGIRFLDGASIPIQTWVQILPETAEWLISAGKLTADVCPVQGKTMSYIVHFVNEHPNGIKFRRPRRLSKGLFLHSPANSNGVVNNAKRLLHHCGVDPGQVWLKLG